MAAFIGNHVRSALSLRYFKGFQRIAPSTTPYITSTKKGDDGSWLTTSKHFHSYNTKCQNSEQLNTPTRLRLCQRLGPTTLCRGLATGGEGLDARQIKSKVDDIAEKFTEARELLEDARDVKGTVYFSEDMKEAAEAVDDTLKDYNNLLSLLNEEQKQNVFRTIGLKMEELKAQKTMLDDMAHD